MKFYVSFFIKNTGWIASCKYLINTSFVSFVVCMIARNKYNRVANCYNGVRKLIEIIKTNLTELYFLFSKDVNGNEK